MLKIKYLLVAAALAIAGLPLMPGNAEAGSRTSIGVGINLGYGYYGPYRPYYGHPYYAPYYGPYWGPPPVYYAPAPPVVYAPAPVVVQPAPGPVVGAPTSAPYVAANGQTCREYQANATIAGQTQPIFGTACLQPDGTWRIVR